MPSEKTTSLNDDERLELVRWLIARYDSLRSSVASRAAIVVSADALLLAGVTFLLDSVLSGSSQYSQSEKILLALSTGADMILLALSIVYATTASAFVWKTSRETLDFTDMPQILFFRQRDTAEAFGGLESFEEKFKATTKEQMLHYALGELLLVTKTHNKRYQTLRQAMRLLLISIVPFLVSVIILFIKFF